MKGNKDSWKGKFSYRFFLRKSNFSTSKYSYLPPQFNMCTKQERVLGIGGSQRTQCKQKATLAKRGNQWSKGAHKLATICKKVKFPVLQQCQKSDVWKLAFLMTNTPSVSSVDGRGKIFTVKKKKDGRTSSNCEGRWWFGWSKLKVLTYKTGASQEMLDGWAQAEGVKDLNAHLQEELSGIMCKLDKWVVQLGVTRILCEVSPSNV